MDFNKNDMMKLEDVNTLKRAQAFLLLYAHDIEEEDVTSRCQYYNDSVTVPELSEYLVQTGVISAELGAEYVKQFGDESPYLAIMGDEYSSQLELLMKNSELPAEAFSADWDGQDTWEQAETGLALFYAAEFLCNKEYRNFIWGQFVASIDDVFHDTDNIDDIDISLAGLDEYCKSIEDVQLPFQA